MPSLGSLKLILPLCLKIFFECSDVALNTETATIFHVRKRDKFSNKKVKDSPGSQIS